MNFTIKRELTTSKKFREFLKHHKYEEYVFKILQKSRKLFDGSKFKQNIEQSNGECDLIYDDNIKYEIKLLIDKEQGALIGDSKKHKDLSEWLYVMLDEVTEFGQCIKKRDLSGVAKTKLYSIMKDRLSSVEADENAIFFSLFPLVVDSKYFRYSQFASDFLQAVYNQLLSDGYVGNRKIYFIYPTLDSSEFVIRDTEHHREFISVPELDDVFEYETV